MSSQRRNAIIEKLSSSALAITGSELAELFDVSRQIIVQDIAIIRASGIYVLATSHGYLIPSQQDQNEHRILKTLVSNHTGFAQMEEELSLILDYGGKIIDVIIEHPVYGEIVGTLHINTRADLEHFLEKVKQTGAKPLSALTEGEHIHTIEVPSEKVYNLIIQELKEKGFV